MTRKHETSVSWNTQNESTQFREPALTDFKARAPLSQRPPFPLRVFILVFHLLLRRRRRKKKVTRFPFSVYCVFAFESSLMGNGFAKLAPCFPGGGLPTGHSRRRYGASTVTWDPCDEGLGHSFCYIRPDAVPGYSGRSFVASAVAAVASEETTMFRSISGASVSANASTPLSTSLIDATGTTAASAFESSTSFSSTTLQPVPRFSGPLSGPLASSDRGFMSGPLERGFMSGPLDPLEESSGFSANLRRTLSHGLAKPRRAAARSLVLRATKAITRAISDTAAHYGSVVAPVKATKRVDLGDGRSVNSSSKVAQWSDSPDSLNGSIQWAQGKAGEDRMHVVVSEERGWVFVGIYDGFNGPDATDYLLTNLYHAVHRELKGLLWDDTDNTFCHEPCDDPIHPPPPARSGRAKGTASKRWKKEFERERLELERKLKEQLRRLGPERTVNHTQVLEALAGALKKTEESFLDIADKMVPENPELALMGSCVLVMLLKGDDLYLMNVGDSRAVLAQKADPVGKTSQDLESISEEALFELTNSEALQLTWEHSTCVAEEVARIRKAHPDDSSAIVNGRVKGSLKVTRAFGAGFLKQPKWNNGLLEMFKIDYVGTLPYITCNPSLNHHKLGPRDRFLILSSDGLYQYFTNEEAVAQVEMFIDTSPEGDPAQHLAEQVLFRAAEKAGMEFHELLEISQGDRRRYHDDISIIIISLEGQIWRSCL